MIFWIVWDISISLERKAGYPPLFWSCFWVSELYFSQSTSCSRFARLIEFIRCFRYSWLDPSNWPQIQFWLSSPNLFVRWTWSHSFLWVSLSRWSISSWWCWAVLRIEAFFVVLQFLPWVFPFILWTWRLVSSLCFEVDGLSWWWPTNRWLWWYLFLGFILCRVRLAWSFRCRCYWDWRWSWCAKSLLVCPTFLLWAVLNWLSLEECCSYDGPRDATQRIQHIEAIHSPNTCFAAPHLGDLGSDWLRRT